MLSFNQINCYPLLNNHIPVQVASKYSGYSSQYLRRLLRNGKLDGIKIGQLWLVDKGGLDAYIKQSQDTIDQRFGPSKSQQKRY